MKRKYSKILNCSIFIFVAIYITGCATLPLKPPKKKLPLRLDTIYLAQKCFNPEKGEFLNIYYKVSMPCQATVTICDGWGIPVKVLTDNKAVSSAKESVLWDGSDDKGIVVPEGVYFYIIELKNGETNYLYNPYQRSHGITLKSVTGFYDQEKNEINYTVPQAARVRIRIGLKDGGPLLVTPLDWTAKTAGNYSLKWDGKDASGNINIARHPQKNMVIFAYTLADNSIIVESSRSAASTERRDMPALFSPQLALDRDKHARNYLNMSHEPRISMELPGGFERTDEGIPVVKGIVPVKISIAPEDRLALENSRYELMFFVDTVFLFEDEAAFSPFTYMWDTRGLTEGEHLFTVNLWSYDDNCGVVTKKVFVKEDTE